MQSLVQGRRKNAEAGEPIFQPFDVLQETGVLLRRGQLTLVAGGPGTGKSAWVFFMLINGLQRKAVNRVLYLSADTDAGTMFIRAAQVLTGWTTEYVESRVRSGDTSELDAIVKAGTAHIQVNYISFPTDEDILDQVNAYLEVYGSLPEVIVMDNLKNLDCGGDGEFAALEANCEFLHEIARDTNAAVITLHHVVGELEDGTKPIPLSGIRGKVSKTPEVVLTLHRDENHLYASPVKNRSGRAEPSGRWILTFNSDLSRMQYSS